MKLKNYPLYFNRILDYCKVINMSVYTQKDLDNCFYSSRTRTILIDESLNNSKQIASMLHEIGHFLDDFDTSKEIEELYFDALDRIDKGKLLTKNQFNALIGCEVGAWNKGELIGKKLDIPLGKWFYNMREECLSNYYETKTIKGVIK